MYTVLCLHVSLQAPNLITDGCEPPCGCWELNSGPLEELSVLLTTEPSLQPHVMIFLKVIVTWIKTNLNNTLLQIQPYREY